MPLAPGLRKLTLTSHVVASVGWFGAVGTFLALAVVGLTSADDGLARAVHVAMEPATWWVIVPLSLASPVTGLVQALGTTWGLFRHYWVIAKLVLTVPATVVLLVHARPIGHLAEIASGPSPLGPDLDGVRVQLLVDAGAALLVLLAATALSTYKPRGLTRRGRRVAR
ncbi:DUF2269 domain-containing protein [Actinosynnema sp. NPDC023658]|uniref:DUF2269 domain-containing protein n=1 Tax=Actinosynnema sp. NPDC023658 TaxID=3155465 RepID=UPI0034103C63